MFLIWRPTAKLKHLEIHLLQTVRQLNATLSPSDFGLASLRAGKLTLLDSGIPPEQLTGQLGLVAFEESGVIEQPVWNAELNARRFALIDQEIQGTLRDTEKLELLALTKLMPMSIESELNLPMEGARKLHRLLTEPVAGGVQSDQ